MYATIDASPLSSEVWSSVESVRLIKNYRARQDPGWASMMMKVANGTFEPAKRIPEVAGGALLDLSEFIPPSQMYHVGQEEEAIKAIFGADLQVSSVVVCMRCVSCMSIQ